ncbi:MAG: FAD-dependent oxidoreductase [Archangium sp.]|nr:FAD-dependent oxidoreductase [Archangium sp.]
MSAAIVIAGAGLAGSRAAEAIRGYGHEGPVLMLGAEPWWPYQRPALSKEVLTEASTTLSSLWLQPEDFYGAQQVEVRRGSPVAALSLEDRVLLLSSGERVAWDRLVIATGSTPRRLDVPGAHLQGVRSLRTWEDARALRDGLGAGARVVVVGGGLLGLEVASAAVARGAEVTVLERGEALLTRVIGRLAGAALVPFVSGKVTLRLGAEVARLRGERRVEGVVLASGEVLAADLVVAALGVSPNTAWLESSGLRLLDGVVVDEFGRASAEGIFAAGDVASAWNPALGRHLRLESYGFAAQHGFTVGRNVAGAREAVFPWPSGSTELFGKRLQFSGFQQGEETCHVLGEPASGRFTALLARHGLLAAVMVLGQPRHFASLRGQVGQPLAQAFQALDAANGLEAR